MVTTEFTIPQQKALATIPKLSGFMSMMGSGFIVLEILRDRKKLDRLYHRLILGMASLDFVISFFMAMSTWLAPLESGVFWAAGTHSTCQMQAFVVHLSVSVSCYNFSLAVYYFLVIGYGKRDRQLHRFEIGAHCSSLSVGLTIAISGLVLGIYRPSYIWCGTASSFQLDATRSIARDIWTWTFAVVVWFVVFSVTFVLIRVFIIVRQQERKAQQWRQAESGQANRLVSQVAAQAFWYCASFYVTWTFPTIMRIIVAVPDDAVPFGVFLMYSILMPCQGLLNFWAYIRPRYERMKRENSRVGPFELLRRVICKTVFFWRSRREADDSDHDDLNPAGDMELAGESVTPRQNESPGGSVMITPVPALVEL